ncbi:2-hydroxyacid dehydrogenase [Plastorhodobacter daqingensis]|uniref:2-hydroxyacid dehydrogenase n=1 Tax=Plastorhodobacter daqingensis TaxID=1387281 RepID=A0ABW2UEV6_9RHOB
MPRLLITRPLPDRVIAAARESFEVTARPLTTPLDRNEMRAALAEQDAILATLGDAFSREVLQAVAEPRCRILANFGVGYNHIDVDAARAAGIVVTNTPGAVTDATADIAMTLILMTARRAGEGERLVRSGQWQGWHPTQMLGLHVSGKKVGIIGMGRIGKAIARRCHFGFGMEVSFFNRSAVADPGVPAQQMETLAELAASVDIVVVAVPGGSATRHLVGAQVLGAMQPHAILVNIARGDVVDEAALIAALESGRIGGAGLDVYEHEPVVPAALRGWENVTLLPHLGTAALEVREAMGLMAVENLRAFFAGQVPPNRV